MEKCPQGYLAGRLPYGLHGSEGRGAWRHALLTRRGLSPFNGKIYYRGRAVDQHGQVLDILTSARRDAQAAQRFFRKVLNGTSGKFSGYRICSVQASLRAKMVQRFLAKLTGCTMKRCRYVPRVIVTDKRASYGAAKREWGWGGAPPTQRVPQPGRKRASPDAPTRAPDAPRQVPRARPALFIRL